MSVTPARPNRSILTSGLSAGLTAGFPAVLPAALVLALAGCGSGSDDDSNFELQTTAHAAAPSAAIEVRGLWMVYLASEAFTGSLAGTVLNADGDTLDDVAVAVNLSSRTADVLGVATVRAVILGDEIYLVVDESKDGVDWDGANGATDLVLLHWSKSAALVEFVDVLDASSAGPLVADGRLYYSADAFQGLVDESTIRFVDATAPLTPVVVLDEAGGGALAAHLLREIDGLLFLSLDEVANAVDLNGDGLADDEAVLALLDGTDPAARVKNVELALESDSAPLAAHVLAANDWLVAFLVDETAQGATNLNDQSLFSQPLLTESCAATPDTDTNDQVLHYLEFADFLGGTPPVNTGLAGHDRVLAFAGFVATISAEADANCNLNAFTGDTDTSDDVARWVATVTPIQPAREPEQMHALATTIGGGSMGLSVLDNRLIAVVDEAADDSNLDGKVVDHDLVGWLEPTLATPVWHFAHQSSTNRSFGTGVFDTDGDSEPFAGTSWMAAEAVGDRLGLTFLEEVPGTNPNVGSLNTNLNCAAVAKDTDRTDGLPVWADFETGPVLDFDGVGYAIDKANAGIVIAGGFAFFRVSEVDDNRDYNNDGVANDVVLFRNPLTTCGPVPMATSSSILSQVISTDGVQGAAFLSSEAQAGIDFDDDGDTTDLVVRFFRF